MPGRKRTLEMGGVPQYESQGEKVMVLPDAYTISSPFPERLSGLLYGPLRLPQKLWLTSTVAGPYNSKPYRILSCMELFEMTYDEYLEYILMPIALSYISLFVRESELAGSVGQ